MATVNSSKKRNNRNKKDRMRCLREERKTTENEAKPKNIVPAKDEANKFQQFKSDNDEISRSDDEDEYIEYVIKPRSYFLFSLCHVCKHILRETSLPCPSCNMIFYCSEQHKKKDLEQHKDLCAVISALAKSRGGHVFNTTGKYNFEDFRKFRISIINIAEHNLLRNLMPFEKEILLYSKICGHEYCREWRPHKLEMCKDCNGLAYCKDNPSHLNPMHKNWCKSFLIFIKIIAYQTMFGRIKPTLPKKILKNSPAISSVREIYDAIYDNPKALRNEVIFSAATQLSTGPLTSWFCSKVSGISEKAEITVHVIGAELEFEADVLNKWELFFLHITPTCSKLNIIFIGPELYIEGFPIEDLGKTSVCDSCHAQKRNMIYQFKNQLYHEYVQSCSYKSPDLISFFNPGLHRFTGYAGLDTWPETIAASTKAGCPVIVTSYTQYESPLDLKRFLSESTRPLEILVPPTLNLYGSQRPERNFISEESAPMIFKNFYCFIVK